MVRYLNEEQTFTPVQVTAMLFTKLKHTAEQALGIKVNDVVIGVSPRVSLLFFISAVHPLFWVDL